MIRLEKVTEDNYRDCLELKVAENQNQFVSSNMLSLSKAYVYYHIVTPYVIYNDDMMIGFMMLRKEDNGYFIWQFMIDERYQSKGYGKQAMKQAIEWMKQDEKCHEVFLTYKEGNEYARKLYIQLGFQPVSKVDEYNEINMVMHL